MFLPLLVSVETVVLTGYKLCITFNALSIGCSGLLLWIFGFCESRNLFDQPSIKNSRKIHRRALKWFKKHLAD
jgi:hypothetical protein